MEFEEALNILHAPERIQEAIMQEYTITCKESKNAALSELKEAEEWLNRQIKYNDEDYTETIKNDNTYQKYVADCIKHSDAMIAILKPLKEAQPKPGGLLGRGVGLTFKEAQELANHSWEAGFNRAACAVYKPDEDYHQKLKERITAAGTIKEKIDYVKGFHGVDKKGKLIPW